jgi:glycosyltransferase involved in cell wall biosynthesis
VRIAFFSNVNSIHLKEWTEYLHSELSQEILVLTIPEPELDYDGVEVVHIGSRLSAAKLAWPALLPSLKRELKRFDADLLVAFRIVSYGALATFSGFRPLVLAAQGGNFEKTSNTRATRFCIRFAVRRADLIHAWSPNLREHLIGYGADPSKILTCSRGIDLRLFPRVPAEPEGPLRIVMTRALKPIYNVELLVRAMPKILDAEPDAVCDIAGDGFLRAELEGLARRLGVEGSIRFLGYLPRPEIVRLLQTAHVYASTTRTDGLPLSHFEAMASGVFPVVTDIEANRIWIEDNANGFLVPLGDSDALATKIVQAYRSEDLRRSAVARNLRLVETEFDRSRNMERMLEAYTELVGRFRRSSR